MIPFFDDTIYDAHVLCGRSKNFAREQERLTEQTLHEERSRYYQLSNMAGDNWEDDSRVCQQEERVDFAEAAARNALLRLAWEEKQPQQIATPRIKMPMPWDETPSLWRAIFDKFKRL